MRRAATSVALAGVLACVPLPMPAGGMALAAASTSPAQPFVDQGSQAYREGRYQDASRLLGQALEAAQADPQLQVVILYELGRTQSRLNEGAQAQATLHRALGLLDAIAPGSSMRPFIQLAIAEAHRESGALAAAREEFEEARVAFERLGLLQGQADALAGIGSVDLAQSRFADALNRYRAAIALMGQASTGTTAVPELGPLQMDTASLMVELGEYDEAHRLLDQADRLCGGKAAASCGAYVDHARSLLAYEQGDYRASADAAGRAAAGFGPEHPIDQARALNNLGIALVKLKRAKEAVPVLQQAIDVETHAGDLRGVAAAVDSLGSAWRGLGRPALARRNYLAALQTWQQLQDREGQRDTLANLGDLAASRHQRASAILLYKLSVNMAQSLRADALRLDPGMRTSLARRVAPAYRKLAGLLIDAGRLAEANQVTRMLKEDERYEFLRGGGAGDTTAALSGAEITQAAQYDRLADSQFAMARELAALAARPSGELDDDDRKRIADLQARLDDASKQLAQFVEALETALAADKRLEPPAVSVAQLKSLQSSLKRLQHGAVLLRYVVLDKDQDALRILLVSPDFLGIRGYTVPVSAAQINNAAADFRRAIDARSPDVVAAARRLYGWMLPAGLRNDLKAAHAGMLMVSLDGALRTVPVAALNDGSHWLVESHPVAIYDDAGATHLEHQPRTDWSVDGFGMTKAVPPLVALHSVKDELDAIIGEGRLPGKAVLDDGFTRDSLHDAIAIAPPPVLHIASHFVFRVGSPDDSFLLLGNGRLTMTELRHWEFSGIDLMTLSACETAVGGGADSHGRELESFASLAQENGADAVLATLWPVYDPSTTRFMSSFYAAHRPVAGAAMQTKAEAIRSAQLAMIRGTLPAVPAAGGASQARGGDTSGDGQRGDVQGPKTRAAAAEDYRHPYYWAPFVLMGNWL